MIIIKGKYNEAKAFTSIIDDGTKNQIETLLDQPFITGSTVRIMPDCHYGKGCVIGTTITIKDKIVPNLVGVDIGCGMLCVKLGKIVIDLASLDTFIHENIPAGRKVNEVVTNNIILLESLYCYNDLKNKAYLNMSMGTLGGGNHFIEIDIAEDGNRYLIIHTGSRNLGKQVAEIYQERAINYQKDLIFNKKEAINKVIKEYRDTNREKEIETEIKRIKKVEIITPMPENLCYLENEGLTAYLHDMEICQQFATMNRMIIAKQILTFLNINFDEVRHFETIHNYINMKDNILRKGAISAYKDETVIIPINMRDGCIIAKGKANPDYNYSAPHGAGRLMSRTKAMEKISIDDYERTMEGIYSTTVNTSTIDESPFAYKPIETIIENIKDTVDIIEIIKPIYSFKKADEIEK